MNVEIGISDSNAHRYKDSGVESLMEVPENWGVKKLKYLTSSELNSFVDSPFGSDLKNKIRCDYAQK